MAAQPSELDPFTSSDLALRSDVSAGIQFLNERGTLSRGRPYAGITRAASDRLIAVARPLGTRASELTHFIHVRAVLPAFPATMKSIVAVLRAILDQIPAHRSTIFVPAPALSAFAVANLELPIVYGSGLLRRTPFPIAVVPWERELSINTVLRVIRSH